MKQLLGSQGLRECVGGDAQLIGLMNALDHFPVFDKSILEHAMHHLFALIRSRGGDPMNPTVPTVPTAPL